MTKMCRCCRRILNKNVEDDSFIFLSVFHIASQKGKCFYCMQKVETDMVKCNTCKKCIGHESCARNSFYSVLQCPLCPTFLPCKMV